MAGVEALKEGGAEREDLIREGDAAAPAPAPAPAPAADGVCAAGVVVAAGGGEEEEEAVLEAVGADADDGLPGVEAAVASWDVPLPMPVLLLLPLVHHACVWCLLVALPLPLPLLLPLLGTCSIDRSATTLAIREGEREKERGRQRDGRMEICARKKEKKGLFSWVGHPLLGVAFACGSVGWGRGRAGRTDGRTEGTWGGEGDGR